MRTSLLLCVNKVRCKNMNAKKNNDKSKERKLLDYQSRLIQRKNDEVEALNAKISKLELSCEEKDDLINSIEHLREDLKTTIMEIKAKGDEYDMLIEDLRLMKKIMIQEVFKSEWRFRLIKLLMK